MTFEPLIDAGPAIQIHVIAAILAFLLGGAILFRRKGDRPHRLAGRAWVALMAAVALTSFFIHTINLVGIWSPIHLLSVATLWYLFRGVQLARQRRITDHRNIMRATYLGALVIAGAFTFLPGRVMHEVFFGGPQPWVGWGVSALLLGVVAFLANRMRLEASPSGNGQQRKRVGATDTRPLVSID